VQLLRQSENLMTRLAVANQKGGVGKTATVANLGAAIALQGYRALLVDCDPQANLTESVGVEVGQGPGVYELLMDDGVSLGDATVPTAFENLSVVPSDLMLAGAEVELARSESRNERLQVKLAGAIGHDFLLMDTPPSLGFLTLNALAAADGVLIPVQASYLAMHGLRRLLETVEVVRSRSNPRLQIAGLLVTMYDRRTVHSQEVDERLREHFGEKVFRTVVDRSVDFDYSTVAGRPLVHDSPRSRGAAAYRRLAQEVIRRAQDADTA
jgi:chromosome partitioning protein